MDYLGEHLLPGRIGHFFVTLTFAASFVATIAYYKAAKSKTVEEEKSWKRLARTAFALDVIGVFAVFRNNLLYRSLIIISNIILRGNIPAARST